MSNEIAVIDNNDWAAKLAAMAAETVKVETPVSGTPVTFKSGIVKYNGNACAGNKLDVVVVGSIFENALYTGKYDPENPASPVCFAFGASEAEMAPHEASESPQAETCKECPKNKWKSADNGKGKACKNIRRLGLIAANPLDETSILEGEMAYAKIPVTSTKDWTSYVNKVSSVSRRPYFTVVTQIGAKPDEQSQFKVTFTQIGGAPVELTPALMERHERALRELQVPYAPNSERGESFEEPAAPKKAKKY